MTAQEIITLFESLVDDSMDQDAALALLNAKLTKVEGERDWSFLYRVQTATGPTFSLPGDYRKSVSLYVGSTPYAKVPFQQAAQYTAAPSATGTVRHTYVRRTIQLGISDSPAWPDEYHALLAFSLAADFFAVDQEERSRSWDDKFAAQAEALKRAMADSDASNQNQGAENAMTLQGSGFYYVDPTTSSVVFLNSSLRGPAVELGIL